MKTEIKNKLIKFFDTEITEDYLAKYIRRFKQETIRLVLKTPDDEYDKDWISEGHYWLTELCEILDPQLEKDL